MKKISIVLIVEDDKWFRELIEKIVVEAGYMAKSVANCYDAIESIDDDVPDAIILDILLPGANGAALMNELSTYTDTRTIPVIICSSVADDLKGEMLSRYGVKRILDKSSMEPSDVVASLRSLE